jgi:hypothetical protein
LHTQFQLDGIFEATSNENLEYGSSHPSPNKKFAKRLCIKIIKRYTLGVLWRWQDFFGLQNSE